MPVTSTPASSTDDAHVHSTSGSTDTPPGIAVSTITPSITTAAVHNHSTSSNNTSSSGGHSHPAMTSSASVDYVNPPFLKLNYIKNISGGLKIAPIGSIVMVDYATPPNGWAICNGENGTVNLVNRFAYGIDPPGEDLLVSGGRETHTHTAKTTGSAGEHNHII